MPCHTPPASSLTSLPPLGLPPEPSQRPKLQRTASWARSSWVWRCSSSPPENCLGQCAKPSAVACRCVRPSRRGLRRYGRLLGRPHTVRSVRREAQPEPGPPAPAGLSRVRGHILGAFCCDRGRSAQGLAFPGKFRVAEIALGHAQKLLSRWSLPLLSCAQIATIQGAGVAFPGAGISRCPHSQFGKLSEIGRPRSEEKNNMCDVRIDPFGAH